MPKLASFLDQATLSDHHIKMALLEFEFDSLAIAMVDLTPAQRELFFRNTSYSAKKQLNKLLDSYKETVQDDVTEAQNRLFELLNRCQSEIASIDMPSMNETPPIRVETHNKHEIFASLLDISQRVQSDGLPALESTMMNINDAYLENFVMKKGLEYILAGRDTKTSKNLMENLKKAMLNNIESHLDMILTGIEQIQQGNSAKELVERLKNYL